MKKKYIATLVAIMLLAGCGTQPPAAPSATNAPDMEAIIQQSVDEALQEKLKEYEEEQKKKDEEIERLKEQLEDLTAQQEAPPEESSSSPDEGASSQAPASSQPAASAPSSQAEVPPQSTPTPKKTTPSSAGGGFDLKNLYPDFVWDSIEEQEPEDEPYEDEDDTAPSPDESPVEEPDEDESDQQAETSQENDASEVIRLVNEKRTEQGLEPLEVDEDLMELAQVRAKELPKKFSHTRPDGTEVVDLGYGENIARGQSSASEVMKDWMNSEGHRYNILWEKYHSIGVARSGSYWVQVFSF